MKASFLAYIVQGIVNNFTPLLFIAFNQHYGIPLEQITLLITMNFTLQLIMDIGLTAFVTRIGYRASLLLANSMAAIGMVLLAILPNFLSNTYLGILIASCFYSTGGELNEVIVSPLVEATPSKNKKQAMSLLHSFYCWGYVGVVLLSTFFMGTSRLLYGKYGNKIDFDKYMLASASLCILSYLLIGLVPHPLVGLLGCALCGFSVGIFWSGTYSTSASVISNGGTLRLLALAGDIDGFMTAKMGGVCASDFFVPSSFQLLS